MLISNIELSVIRVFKEPSICDVICITHKACLSYHQQNPVSTTFVKYFDSFHKRSFHRYLKMIDAKRSALPAAPSTLTYYTTGPSPGQALLWNYSINFTSQFWKPNLNPYQNPFQPKRIFNLDCRNSFVFSKQLPLYTAFKSWKSSPLHAFS